jgi:hypothetical protein
MALSKAYQLDEADDDQVYGEFDEKHLHPFPKGWMGRVVVRQVDVQQLASGSIVEDPGTIKIMNYETEVYNHLVEKKLFGSNVKVSVLHDPR